MAIARCTRFPRVTALATSLLRLGTDMLTLDWTSARRAEERRLTHRSPVSWPVWLWLEENLFTPARAVDISRDGIGIRLSPAISKALLRLGQSYLIEICPGYADDFFCLAEVRYLSEHKVGLWIKEALPLGQRDSRRALHRLRLLPVIRSTDPSH
jgi:hypothetical protein